MHRPISVDLAPRAKKHGACQRVEALFRALERFKRSSSHYVGAFTRFLCGRLARRPALDVPSQMSFVESRKSMCQEGVRLVQSGSPNRGSRKVLCTRAIGHSAFVTSRHTHVTLLQCTCRCPFKKNLFMPIQMPAGTGISRGAAALFRRALLIHKVIHTAAP